MGVQQVVARLRGLMSFWEKFEFVRTNEMVGFVKELIINEEINCARVIMVNIAENRESICPDKCAGCPGKYTGA